MSQDSNNPTDARDEELDSLEEELSRPYIHEPDEKPAGDGSTCWINATRLCGPDCKAFNPHEDPPQGPNQCLLLAYAGQAASGVIGVAKLFSRIRQSSEDNVRRDSTKDEVPQI